MIEALNDTGVSKLGYFAKGNMESLWIINDYNDIIYIYRYIDMIYIDNDNRNCCGYIHRWEHKQKIGGPFL